MRASSELERRVLAIIEPEAMSLGLDVVRVRIMGQRTPLLQIMAEKPDGTMDVEDCAKLSRKVSVVLDEKDPIKEGYTLEVSSPGIDRPLTRPGDFANWAGHEARVEIEVPVNGRRRFHGFILGEEGGSAMMRLKEGGDVALPLSGMTKARLVLTDKLIDAAQARGQVPQEISDEDFDEVAESEAPPDAGVEDDDAEFDDAEFDDDDDYIDADDEDSFSDEDDEEDKT
jgi:ribosome maturation factor RimP